MPLDATAESLPLDRRWRLPRYVIHHPIDAAHLVDDAVADAAEQAVRQFGPVGGHGILRLHGAQRVGPFVGAALAHHSARLHRQEYREALAGQVLPTLAAGRVDGVAQLFDEDG